MKCTEQGLAETGPSTVDLLLLLLLMRPGTPRSAPGAVCEVWGGLLSVQSAASRRRCWEGATNTTQGKWGRPWQTPAKPLPSVTCPGSQPVRDRAKMQTQAHRPQKVGLDEGGRSRDIHGVVSSLHEVCGQVGRCAGACVGLASRPLWHLQR